MAKQSLQQIKRQLVGRNVFLFKLLDPFPQVEFVSGIDAGYYAVNIAMAYRHLKFKEPQGTITKFTSIGPVAASMPLQRQSLVPGGVVLGGGSQNSFLSAAQLQQVAVKQGYKRSEVKTPITFDAVKDLVGQQYAPVVAMDVNAHGDPGYYGGANAQWCVIMGFAIYKDGSKHVVATHSWGGYYLWNIDELIQSNIQLLAIPSQVAQGKLVNSSSSTASPGSAAVSLNEVRNKMVLVRV